MIIYIYIYIYIYIEKRFAVSILTMVTYTQGRSERSLGGEPWQKRKRMANVADLLSSQTSADAQLRDLAYRKLFARISQLDVLYSACTKRTFKICPLVLQESSSLFCLSFC